MTDTDAPYVVLARAAAVDHARHGYENLTELAKAAGLHGSTLRRVHAGTLLPGGRVIAGLMRLTGLPFDELFTIGPDPGPDK